MNKKKMGGIGAALLALIAWLFGGNTINAVPKAPISTVAVHAMAVGPDSLIVTWTAAPTSGSAVDSYRVSILTNGQVAMTPATVGASVLRFAWAIAGVQPGQSVTLLARVEAHNGKGWGASGEASTTYTAADMVPGAPTVQLQVKPTP